MLTPAQVESTGLARPASPPRRWGTKRTPLFPQVQKDAARLPQELLDLPPPLYGARRVKAVLEGILIALRRARAGPRHACGSAVYRRPPDSGEAFQRGFVPRSADWLACRKYYGDDGSWQSLVAA